MTFTRAQLVHELGLIVDSCAAHADLATGDAKETWIKRGAVGEAIFRMLEQQPFTQEMVDALKEAQDVWTSEQIHDATTSRKYDLMTQAIEQMQSLVNSH